MPNQKLRPSLTANTEQKQSKLLTSAEVKVLLMSMLEEKGQTVADFMSYAATDLSMAEPINGLPNTRLTLSAYVARYTTNTKSAGSSRPGTGCVPKSADKPASKSGCLMQGAHQDSAPASPAPADPCPAAPAPASGLKSSKSTAQSGQTSSNNLQPEAEVGKEGGVFRTPRVADWMNYLNGTYQGKQIGEKMLQQIRRDIIKNDVNKTGQSFTLRSDTDGDLQAWVHFHYCKLYQYQEDKKVSACI